MTVNGVLLGIYTHIEEIKKPMLKFNYGEDADKTDLYELTLADFTEEHIPMFEPKWDTEENKSHDLSGLRAVADVLTVDDDELMSSLGKVLDVEKLTLF